MIIPLFGKEKTTLFHIVIPRSSKIICWSYFSPLILNYLAWIFKLGQHVLQGCLAKLVILGNASRMKSFCGYSRRHLGVFIRDENPMHRGYETCSWGRSENLTCVFLSLAAGNSGKQDGSASLSLFPLCSIRGDLGTSVVELEKLIFSERIFYVCIIYSKIY